MPNQNLKSSKILIVDDTRTNVELLRDILAPLGYKLFFAGSGEQALQLVPKVEPDLILLDVMMPGIDGFETCKKLKTMSDCKDIPIIFATACSDPKDLAKGFSVGAVDYITKPVNQAEVEARVYTHLRIRDLIKSQERIISTLEGGLEDQTTGVASMGHELRTPLTSIIGYSDLLMEDLNEIGTKASKECLIKAGAINNAGKYLLRLINNVLDLAKLDVGKMQADPETFSISDWLRGVELTIQPLVKKNDNILKINCPKNISETYSDKTKLQQILVNLIGNACKFTEHGQIRLDIRENANSLYFEVSDTGIGMSEEQQSRLFQSFQQADKSIAGEYGGTGLGLAISQRLAHLLGGDISVSSRPGEGTTFSVVLPRKLPDQDEILNKKTG